MNFNHDCWILDTGPLLEQFPVESLLRTSTSQDGVMQPPNVTIYTTPSVVNEVKSEFARVLLESRIHGGTITVMNPDPEASREVEKKLKKTGSWWILSPTDRDVLALALTLKSRGNPIIITNDFELQNACMVLKLKWHEFNRMGTNKPRIRDQITWIFQCTTCKRKYKKLEKQCPNCGGLLKRKVKKARRIRD